jgi:hypothetical protein
MIFIKEYASQIDRIDDDKVKEILSQVDYEKEISGRIEHEQDRVVNRYLERKHNWVGEINYFGTSSDVDQFNIYEMNDGTYLLLVRFYTILTVDAEVEVDEYDFDDYDRVRNITKYKTLDIEFTVTYKFWLNEAFDITSHDIEEIDLA